MWLLLAFLDWSICVILTVRLADKIMIDDNLYHSPLLLLFATTVFIGTQLAATGLVTILFSIYLARNYYYH